MKKTSIILSTMILASGSLGVTLPNALASESSGKITSETLSNDPLTGENLPVFYETTERNKVAIRENAPDAIFRFLSVDYKQNRMGIQINEHEDWLIRRIVVAYRDYERGVTEAEADANLETLGEEGTTIWKMLWDEDAEGMPSIYQYVIPKENGVWVSLEDNLTDIVYYAVEYGHKSEVTGEWQDTWWERGKINYRNCVHASVFDPEMMICVQEEDGSYGAMMRNGTGVEIPTEEIISWNKEWNAVQLQRHKETASQLADLRYNLYNIVKILDGADQTLAGLDVTLPKTEGMANRDEIMAENARLKDLSRTIREYYTGINNAAIREELKLLKQEKTEWLLEKVRIEENRERVEQENAELRREIALLKQGGDGQNDGKEENDVVGVVTEGKADKVEELVATTETKIVVVEREKEPMEENSVADESQKEIEARGAVKEDEVIVPNLGDLEEKAKMTWWWVVIAGVGALAGLSLGLSRIFGRSKRK